MVTCQTDIIIFNGVRISMKKKKKEVARVYLYILHNDYHKTHVGYLEDLFIDEMHRSKEIEAEIMKAVTREARRRKCYKVVATSKHDREPVHEFYKKAGFRGHGIEFRMDLV